MSNGLGGTPSDGDVRTGLIAQQVQQVAPDLVSTTSAFLNVSDTAPTQLLEVNYGALPLALINAVKELYQDFTALAQSITTKLLTADAVQTQQLCVGSPCVTPQQFQAMVAAANQSGTGANGTGSSTPPSSTSTASSSDDSSATPPVLQVNGDNPAIIQVGATYTDLGATITGPTADLNLGITTYVNGAPMNAIQIDTTEAGTDTIQYVATDQSGLTSTSTRTVIIEAAPSIVPTAAASSTATSSAQ